MTIPEYNERPSPPKPLFQRIQELFPGINITEETDKDIYPQLIVEYIKANQTILNSSEIQEYLTSKIYDDEISPILDSVFTQLFGIPRIADIIQEIFSEHAIEVNFFKLVHEEKAVEELEALCNKALDEGGDPEEAFLNALSPVLRKNNVLSFDNRLKSRLDVLLESLRLKKKQREEQKNRIQFKKTN